MFLAKQGRLSGAVFLFLTPIPKEFLSNAD